MREPDRTETVTARDGQTSDAWVWLPASGSGPGILLLQEIFGVSSFLRAKASDLADLGYVVACPDVFWRTERHVDHDHDDAGLQAAFASMSRWAAEVPEATTRDDLLAALDHLRALPEVDGKVAVMGYCLGGRLAYELAAAGDPDACVAYYGSGIGGRLDDTAESVTCPTIFHYGGADPFIPARGGRGRRQGVRRPRRRRAPRARRGRPRLREQRGRAVLQRRRSRSLLGAHQAVPRHQPRVIAPTHRHTRATWYRRPGGPWDGPTLDLLLSTARPRDDLVVDGEVRLSSVQVNHLAARVAAGLRAAGVRRRDVVAWQLPNRWEVVVLYRACWRLGAVATPVHHLAGPADAEAMLAQAPPRLVVEAARLPALLAAPPLHASVRPARPADPAVVLFTSGSSGRPKAVVHTHRGLAHKARLMVDVHGLRRKDAVLMPAPLAHVSGLLNGVLVPGAAGMRTVLAGPVGSRRRPRADRRRARVVHDRAADVLPRAAGRVELRRRRACARSACSPAAAPA